LGSRSLGDSRLLATLITAPGTWHRLRWPAWRRRHQHRAGSCHYQRQARQLRTSQSPAEVL